MADKDINSLKKELFNLKIMKKSGQLTDTSQFKKVKKQIASLLTKERLEKMPKRILSGKVIKKSGDKTVSVLVTRQTTHPIYKKIMRVSKKYLAHDTDNNITVGENVKIQETKPLSKSKSWEIIK